MTNAAAATVAVNGTLVTWTEHGQPREAYATSTKAAERVARRIANRLKAAAAAGRIGLGCTW